jgi:DnaK suppressor protein
MIVSILQLMAFPFGRPSAERGGENPSRKGLQAGNQGITRVDEGDRLQERGQLDGQRHSHAAAVGVRRQDVKPQPKATAKAAKPAAKAKTPPKPAKPAAKAAAKKSPAKKAPAKAAKPAASKTPLKSAPKVAATKATAKSPAKKSTAKKAAPLKAAAKPATRKTPAPKAKAAVKAASQVKAVATEVKPSKASAPKATPVPAPVAPARAMPPRPTPAAVAAEPARATKPSARLAQITVPSMAQTVASTAAKASYTQTMSPSVLTPPPLVAVKKDPKLANNWKTKSAEELTDAEVLAMPDSEYMNDKQMAFFRLKLVQLKQDILNSAGETTEHLREDTVIVPDPADRATIEEEHALELRTRDRERKLLKKIEQSIARIDAGDYGYCDETGEPIGVGRLLARPTATLSLEAQQRRELKQKMFGD